MHNKNVKVWGYRLLWVLLLAAYLVLPLGHLDDYARNYDEGPQLQAAALLQEGYPLYSEVVVNKPPLMSWLVALGFRLGDMTIETGRLTILFTTFIGFAALGLLAEQWWGRGAGVAAMALFLALPETPVRALYVMNDLPAMSLALVSLVSATTFRRTRKWGALVLSGVAYAFAILLHPLVFYMALPVLLVLFYPRRRAAFSLQRHLGLVALWGGVVLTVTALAIVQVDLPGLLRWVLGYNLNPQLVERVSENWETLWTFWQGLPLPLIGMACVSAAMLIVGASRNRLWLGAATVWFYLTAGVLFLLRPLWPHYCIFTLYPLILLISGGLVEAVRWGVQGKARTRVPVWRWGLVGLLCVGLAFFVVARTQELPHWKPWSDAYHSARLFLEEACEPKELVISDNQFLAFASGCLVPPSLADTSGKRIETGLLSESEIIDNLRRYQVRYVSIGTTRLRTQLGIRDGIDLLSDAEWHFDRTFIYHIDRALLEPELPTATVIADAIRLQGYRIEGTFEPGEQPLVVLYWESLASVDEDWTVFVHMVDDAGNLVGQHDSPPFMGGCATQTWQPGYQILDPHPLALGSDFAAGRYRILMGMYRDPAFERLPAWGEAGRWPDDVIQLSEITVQP